VADETVKVTVVADTGRYTASMRQAAAETSKLDKAAASVSKQMSGMAKGFALAGATTVAVGQIGDAVKAAVNLQDSVSKTGVVFGKASDDILAFASDSKQSFGLTKTAALDAASTFAIFGKAAGLTGDELTKFSTELTQRAVDLKSFYGGSVQDAITAVGAALRGEMEPIRNYGVVTDDLGLRQRALKMHLIDSVKEGLNPQIRALVAAAEVMDQTSVAAGDYEETIDGAANSLNELATQWGRLKEESGTAFTGPLAAVARGGADVLNIVNRWKTWIDATEGTHWYDIFTGFQGDAYGAADAADSLNAAAHGAAGGVDTLGAHAGMTGAQLAALTTDVDSAADSLNNYIDAQQGLLGSKRDLRGIGADILDAARQPAKSGGAGKESEADRKARQKVIDGIREQDHAEEEAEIKRARRRAQRKADEAADRGARRDTQAGVAGAIATDKAARAGQDIDGNNQRGTVGEATGSLSKSQQKKLDKEIEGIRARHKKALDAQLKGLEGAQGAAKGAAGATDTYSHSLSENTEAGRRNLDQLDRGVDAVQAAGDKAAAVAKAAGGDVEEQERARGEAMLRAREDLLDTYASLGFARSEVDKYLAKIGLVPKKITTTFKAEIDTSELDAAVRKYGPGKGKVWNPSLGAWLPGGTPGAIPTSPAEPSYPKKPTVKPTPHRPNSPYASGGEIYGPGGPRSDSVPIWASAGEFMVNASQYAANRDLVRAINAGNGPVSGAGGMSIGSVTVHEASASGVRVSVIDALAEAAYRHGVVR
jgi:hypothetical protein